MAPSIKQLPILVVGATDLAPHAKQFEHSKYQNYLGIGFLCLPVLKKLLNCHTCGADSIDITSDEEIYKQKWI